ncbi:MAG TPA: site-specific DNA-methyltransferase, partial [Longimicrobiaceae bacterium]
YRLEYEGKTREEEILATEPARLRRVLEIGGEPANRICFGDNLRVLRSLLDDPQVRGGVRLVYIDPPYATRSRFESRDQDHAYEDLLAGSRYLEFLRKRLVLMRELLAADGSIYVHLDDKMAFPVKVLMDEVFGPGNFRNWITRKKCNPKNYTRKTFGNVADYVLFYSRSDRYVWNQQFEPLDAKGSEREYRHVEEGTGRRYMKVPVHAPGVRNGETGREWKGMMPPPGKHWQYRPSTLDEMDARGEIVWSDSGNPRRKVYLDQRPGVAVQDVWMDFRDAHNQNVRITGYPTEKSPDLLRRIISASSNPGDLVLDAFAGSGTTAAVAEEMGRRWLAVDDSPLALRTMIQRLAAGSERMGDFVNGKGGRAKGPGSFDTRRVLRSGLSVYTEDSPHLEPITDEQVRGWEALLRVALTV